MINFSRQKAWTNDIRAFLLHAGWRYHHSRVPMNGTHKMRWILQMDDPSNSRTFVNVSHNSFVIELRFERIIDGIDYSAGKRIRIDDFYIFRTLFDQD